MAPKRNVFLGKHFADLAIKKSKRFLANLKYQTNTHPWPHITTFVT
jgi:hypothetical protein